MGHSAPLPAGDDTPPSTHTPETAEAFALDIDWDPIGLPSLVGPFESDAEAREWGNLNVPNGVWSVRPLAYPYMRTTPAGGAS